MSICTNINVVDFYKQHILVSYCVLYIVYIFHNNVSAKETQSLLTDFNEGLAILSKEL